MIRIWIICVNTTMVWFIAWVEVCAYQKTQYLSLNTIVYVHNTKWAWHGKRTSGKLCKTPLFLRHLLILSILHYKTTEVPSAMFFNLSNSYMITNRLFGVVSYSLPTIGINQQTCSPIHMIAIEAERLDSTTSSNEQIMSSNLLAGSIDGWMIAVCT